jgi:hypothetical protein
MAEHFEAIEADFAREYPEVCDGDLREALWGSNAIGVRRLNALIHGFPPRSTTARAMQTGGQEWGNTEEMLATMCELVDMTNRTLVAMNSKKGTKLWRPLHIPRPFKLPSRKVATGAALARFFNRKEASGRIRYGDG